MDLTRSTTSRYAAMVRRVFDRARDPQRMWISKKKKKHQNQMWTKTFLLQRQFLWKRMLFKKTKKKKMDFLRRSINSVFFFDEGISRKQFRKKDERTSFLFRCQMTEIQKIYSWSGLNRCFCVRKRSRLSCLKEQD